MEDFMIDLTQPTNEEPKLSPDMEKMLQFINMLWGSVIKVKEIHFNTHDSSTHKLCDKIQETLLDYIDELGESIQGFANQRFGYNTLKPIIPESSDLEEILRVLGAKSLQLEAYYSEPIYSGITSVTSDFREDLHKFNYLRTFD